MLPLNVFTEIKHYPCKKVNDQRETDRQKRGINKKQAYLGDRDIKAFTKVGTYTE
jgi:hypothetical protein